MTLLHWCIPLAHVQTNPDTIHVHDGPPGHNVVINRQPAIANIRITAGQIRSRKKFGRGSVGGVLSLAASGALGEVVSVIRFSSPVRA